MDEPFLRSLADNVEPDSLLRENPFAANLRSEWRSYVRLLLSILDAERLRAKKVASDLADLRAWIKDALTPDAKKHAVVRPSMLLSDLVLLARQRAADPKFGATGTSQRAADVKLLNQLADALDVPDMRELNAARGILEALAPTAGRETIDRAIEDLLRSTGKL